MLDVLFGPSRRTEFDTQWLTSTDRAGFGRRPTTAGVDVDAEVALTYGALWSGLRLLSETTAGLPLFLYQRNGEDREPATSHRLFDLLHSQPNPDMGSMAWREGRLVHQILWGSGFSEIVRSDRTNEVIALWPIHPARVMAAQPGQTDRYGRSLYPDYPYLVANNDGSQMAMRADEVLHIPGALSEDGIWGRGLVAYAKETIGAGLAVEKHAASSFGSGAVPPAIVYGNGMKDKDARRMFRQEWKEIHGHPGQNEIAILPTDAKYETVTLPAEANQYIQTRQIGVLDIARWLRIPPHLLMDLQSGASYASVELMSLEFVIYSLMPWIRRWEGQLQLKLLRPQERQKYFIEHQLAGLLRGDMKSRFDAYSVALNNGFMTRNEVRRLENLNSLGSDGDKVFVPVNMQTLDRAVMVPETPAEPTEPTPEETAATEATEAAAGEPALALLDVPDRRQESSYDCGAACTHSVAEFWGVDNGREQQDYIDELGTTKTAGTTPEAIVAWCNDNGLTTTSGQGMTVEDLRHFFEQGHPVICPMQLQGITPEYDGEEERDESGHYVVVLGVGLEMVFYQDPVSGRQMMDAAEFDRRWHDVKGDGIEVDHYGIAVGEAVPTENKPEGSEARNGVMPKKSGAADVPSAENVQATALNGAQIASLLAIADKLSLRQYPAEGTRAMIEASFPMMDRDLIDTIVTELEKFKPKPLPAAPSPFGKPPGSESEKPEEEPEESAPNPEPSANGHYAETST